LIIFAAFVSWRTLSSTTVVCSRWIQGTVEHEDVRLQSKSAKSLGIVEHIVATEVTDENVDAGISHGSVSMSDEGKVCNPESVFVSRNPGFCATLQSCRDCETSFSISNWEDQCKVHVSDGRVVLSLDGCNHGLGHGQIYRVRY
jgi:hypothetical protein